MTQAFEIRKVRKPRGAWGTMASLCTAPSNVTLSEYANNSKYVNELSSNVCEGHAHSFLIY